MENFQFDRRESESAGSDPWSTFLQRTKEFRWGRKPFRFDYELLRGEKLRGYEDQHGFGHVVIEHGGQTIFDASRFLPEGFRLVTPAYLRRHPNEESFSDYFDRTWATDSERKLVFLGEFEGPQDLLALFHELGHARCDTPDDLLAEKRIHNELEKLSAGSDGLPGDRAYEILLTEDEAKLLSIIERRAWAWAIRAFRRIRRESGVNLYQLFPSFKAFKDYVQESLGTYRRGYEWIIREGHDPEFYRELQRCFDKWCYASRSNGRLIGPS